MPDRDEFNTGLLRLSNNFSSTNKKGEKVKADYTTEQKEILWNYFGEVSGEVWFLMIRSLIETETYLPRTNKFFKAKNAIEEGTGGREKTHVPCNTCEGEGLMAAIGKFGERCPNMRYVMMARCSCENANNYSRKIMRRSEMNDDPRIEHWCTVREVPHYYQAFDEPVERIVSGNLAEALAVVEGMIP